MLLLCLALLLFSLSLAIQDSPDGYNIEGKIFFSNPVINVFEDSPNAKVLFLRPNNGPASGLNTITVIGENFGTSNSEILITVGGVDCLSTEWMSSTAARCIVPKGSPGAEIVRVLVNGICSEDGPSYTYFFSMVYKIEPATGPIFGGTLITLTGEAIASPDVPINVFVGGTPCSQPRVVSNKVVTCVTPAAEGVNFAIAEVTLISGSNRVVPTCEGCNFKFTYKIPTVLKTSPSRGPTCGGQKIQITGSDLCDSAPLSPDNVPIVNVGGVPCLNVQWVTRTVVSCVTSPANGPGKANVEVIVKSYNSEENFAYNYDPPLILSVDPAEGPSYGGEKITVVGQHFGRNVHNINIFVSGIPCSDLKLINPKTATCITPPIHKDMFPIDGPSPVTLAVLTVPCKRCGAYTYIAPVIESISPVNGPVYGGSRISIVGRHFGVDAQSDITVMIGRKQCLALQFISDTEVSCTVPPSQGPGPATLTLTVDTITSRISSEFTYESPIIENVQPRSGGQDTEITITGRHLGNINLPGFAPTVRIADVPCYGVTSEVKDTLKCTIPPGHGPGAAKVSVLVNGFECKVCGEFVYGIAVGHSISPMFGPSYGGNLVTVVGFHLDSVDSVVIGEKVCHNLNVLSPTELNCISPPSEIAGEQLLQLLDARGVPQENSVLTFTYKAPLPLEVNPSFSPSYGNVMVEIIGDYFGTSTSVVVASIGGVPCISTIWVSEKSLQCLTPPRRGCLDTPDMLEKKDKSIEEKMFAVSVCVNNVCNNIADTRNSPLLLTYRDPIIHSVEPQSVNIFSTSNKIHLTGEFFGSGEYIASTVYVGGIQCLRSFVIDSNNMTCTLPPLNDEDLTSRFPVKRCVTVSVPQGTCSRYFSQSRDNGPCITFLTTDIHSVEPARGEATGGTKVIISGNRLGSHQSKQTPRVFFGASECKVIDWANDDTSITCITSPSQYGHGPQPISIVIDRYAATQSSFCFSYNKPIVYSSVPLEGPFYGGNILHIYGSGFGNADLLSKDPLTNGTFKIMIGDKVCEDAQIISSQEAVCNSIPPAFEPGLVAVRLVMLGEYLDSSVQADANNAIVMYKYNAPILTSITPSYGPFYGNTTITVIGANFGAKDSFRVDVLIGSSLCMDVVVNSETELTCNVPPCGKSDCANVPVSIIVGNEWLNWKRQIISESEEVLFEYKAPTVSSISPQHGSEDGGTFLTIHGDNLGLKNEVDTTVLLGGFECKDVKVVDSTLLTCLSPPGMGNNLNILVSVAGINSSSLVLSEAVFSFSSAVDTFSYDNPVIYNIFPDSGPVYGGNLIQINGSNFGELKTRRFSRPYVFINDALCVKTIYVSDNLLECVAPSFGTVLSSDSIKVQLQIMIGGSKIAETVPYTYLNIFVSGVEPSDGPIYGGTLLTVSGENIGYMIPEENKEQAFYEPVVLLGGIPCSSVKLLSNTSLTCVTLPHPQVTNTEFLNTQLKGSLKLKILNHANYGNKNHTAEISFAYKYPEITSISPSTGSLQGGSKVTITGRYLGLRDKITPLVLFGTVPASSCTFDSADQSILYCITPDVYFSGPVKLVIVIGHARIQSYVEYIFLLPVITEISPNNGTLEKGDLVVIQGTNFGRATQILIGAELCGEAVHFSETIIKCRTPFATEYSDFSILPYFGNFEDTIEQYFAKQKNFVLTRISPSKGDTKGFYSMNIQGENLPVDDKTLFMVFIGGEPCMKVEVIDEWNAKCQVPPGVGSNLTVSAAFYEEGLGYVSMSNSDFDSELSFSYNPPRVVRVTPNKGPSNGGYVVSILGSNFLPAYSSAYYFNKLSTIVKFVTSSFAKERAMQEIKQSMSQYVDYTSGLMKNVVGNLKDNLSKQDSWLEENQIQIEKSVQSSIDHIDSSDSHFAKLHQTELERLKNDTNLALDFVREEIEKRDTLMEAIKNRAQLAYETLSNNERSSIKLMKEKIKLSLTDKVVGILETEEIKEGVQKTVHFDTSSSLVTKKGITSFIEKAEKLISDTQFNACVSDCVTDDLIEKAQKFYDHVFPFREEQDMLIPYGAAWMGCNDWCGVETDSDFINNIIDPIVEKETKCSSKDIDLTIGGRECFKFTVESDSEIRCMLAPFDLSVGGEQMSISIAVHDQLSNEDVSFYAMRRTIRNANTNAVTVNGDIASLFDCGESMIKEPIQVFVGDSYCDIIHMNDKGITCNLPSNEESTSASIIYGDSEIDIEM